MIGKRDNWNAVYFSYHFFFTTNSQTRMETLEKHLNSYYAFQNPHVRHVLVLVRIRKHDRAQFFSGIF